MSRQEESVNRSILESRKPAGLPIQRRGADRKRTHDYSNFESGWCCSSSSCKAQGVATAADAKGITTVAIAIGAVNWGDRSAFQGRLRLDAYPGDGDSGTVKEFVNLGARDPLYRRASSFSLVYAYVRHSNSLITCPLVMIGEFPRLRCLQYSAQAIVSPKSAPTVMATTKSVFVLVGFEPAVHRPRIIRN